MSNREVRSFTGAAAPMIKGRAVSGYAIVFNSKSEVMVDFGVGDNVTDFRDKKENPF